MIMIIVKWLDSVVANDDDTAAYWINLYAGGRCAIDNPILYTVTGLLATGVSYSDINNAFFDNFYKKLSKNDQEKVRIEMGWEAPRRFNKNSLQEFCENALWNLYKNYDV